MYENKNIRNWMWRTCEHNSNYLRHTAIIKQFLEDVQWGELDFLVVDTPPGTSDEHISICELLNQYNPDGAIIVTTPQVVKAIIQYLNTC